MDISKNITGTYGTMYMVRDMQKSVQYYKEMLNLTPEAESPEWTSFDLNGHRICLHATAPDAAIDGKGVLITSVKDLDLVVAELKKRGVEFVQEVQQVCDGGFAADFKDPSGNVVSLFEYRG
jgi:predicted enzyme related to lactoylglutathione lyase